MAIKREVFLVLLLAITISFLSINSVSSLSICGNLPYIGHACSDQGTCNEIDQVGDLCYSNIMCNTDTFKWECSNTGNFGYDDFQPYTQHTCNPNNGDADCGKHDICVGGNHRVAWWGTYMQYPGSIITADGFSCSVGAGEWCGGGNYICTVGSCVNDICTAACTPQDANWGAFGNCLDASNNQVTCGTGTQTRTCSGTASCGGANNCIGSSTQSCTVTSGCQNGCGAFYCTTKCNANYHCDSASLTCGGNCVPDCSCANGCNPDGSCKTNTCNYNSFSWSTCYDGSQTKSYTSSNTPCTGGNVPADSGATQSCLVSNGGHCTGSAQCSSGFCNGNTCSTPPASCTPSWSCSGFGQCNSGTQTQTCTDLNNCGTISGKPAESRSCSACTINDCTSWSSCSSGSKTCTSLPSSCYGSASSFTTTTGCDSIITTGATLGQPCGPLTYCASGLTCSNSITGGVCQQTNVGAGGTCSVNQLCLSSLQCFGGVCTSCTAGTSTNGLCINGQKIVTTPYVPSGCKAIELTTASCSGTTGDNCKLNSQCASNICSSNDGTTQGTCQAPTTTSLILGSWTDMTGSTITSSDLNDRVIMSASGGDLSGKQITFTWYQKCSGLLCSDTQLGTATVNAQTNTVATYNASISSSGTIYFRASVSGGNTITSSNLIVSNFISDAIPVVSITSPAPGSVSFISAAISFTQNSYDIDSKINSYLWDFGDGQTSSLINPTHSYSSAGEKTITLTVTDEQGNSAKNQISIIILGSSGNVYAFVNPPSPGSVVVNNNLLVSYGAQASYALANSVDGNSCITQINCISGACPNSLNIIGAQAGACSTVSATYSNSVGSTANYNLLYFNWTFRDAGIFMGPVMGLGKVSGTQGFSSTGQKNISLKINTSISGTNVQQSTSREFTLFKTSQCSSDGATWYDIKNGKVVSANPTIGAGSNPATCKGADSTAGTIDDCCPAGQICGADVNGQALGCQLDDTSKTCQNYQNQAECNLDASNRVINGPLWSYYKCGTTNSSGYNIICNCSWIAGSCQFTTNSRISTDPVGSVASCSYASQSDACVDGYQIVHITATGDPSCQSSTQKLACGRPVVELPFVSTVTLVGAFILIVIIYFFIRPRKKSKRRR